MGGHEKTYFEQQREVLLGEIAVVSHLCLYTSTNANNQAELRACPSQYQQTEPISRGSHSGMSSRIYFVVLG
jgi:hypothetical protein